MMTEIVKSQKDKWNNLWASVSLGFVIFETMDHQYKEQQINKQSKVSPNQK